MLSGIFPLNSALKLKKRNKNDQKQVSFKKKITVIYFSSKSCNKNSNKIIYYCYSTALWLVNFQGSQDSAVLAVQLEDMEAVEDLSGSDYGSDITGSEYFCRLHFFFFFRKQNVFEFIRFSSIIFDLLEKLWVCVLPPLVFWQLFVLATISLVRHVVLWWLVECMVSDLTFK